MKHRIFYFLLFSSNKRAIQLKALSGRDPASDTRTIRRASILLSMEILQICELRVSNKKKSGNGIRGFVPSVTPCRPIWSLDFGDNTRKWTTGTAQRATRASRETSRPFPFFAFFTLLYKLNAIARSIRRRRRRWAAAARARAVPAGAGPRGIAARVCVEIHAARFSEIGHAESPVPGPPAGPAAAPDDGGARAARGRLDGAV